MRISDWSSDVCSSDLRAIAQRRRLVLLLAGPEEIALAWKADGFHGRSGRKRRHARLIHTAPAHDVPELRKAERTAADLLFISPVFPRSEERRVGKECVSTC